MSTLFGQVGCVIDQVSQGHAVQGFAAFIFEVAYELTDCIFPGNTI
jgi:hypothetical protein